MDGLRKMFTGSEGGFVQGIADHLKLVWRLWRDQRISPLLKILPFGSLIYMISPLDIAIPYVDDLGVVWFFTYLFVELCPEDIVNEHRMKIKSLIGAEWKNADLTEIKEEDIVDASYEEKDAAE